MLLLTARDEYLYATATLSAETQRWYSQKLSHFVTWALAHECTTVAALTSSLLRRYTADLPTLLQKTGKKAPSSYTIHGYAQVVKGFCTWLVDEELLAASPYQRVKMPKLEEKVIVTFRPEHIKKLLGATALSRMPLRDKAVVAVLLDTGIRAGELCSLLLTNTHLSPTESYLVVRGKGKKERQVALGTQARLALSRYLHRERPKTTAEETFVGWFGRRLTVNALESVLERLNQTALIDDVRVSPHTFRHTMAVTYLKHGGDIYMLSRLLGHSALQITTLYLRDMPQRDIRKASSSPLDQLLSAHYT